jgi:hypothetical protein
LLPSPVLAQYPEGVLYVLTLFNQLKISLSIIGRTYSTTGEKLDVVAEKLDSVGESERSSSELDGSPSSKLASSQTQQSLLLLSSSSPSSSLPIIPPCILSHEEAFLYNPIILDVVGVYNVPLNVPLGTNLLGNCYVAYQWMNNKSEKMKVFFTYFIYFIFYFNYGTFNVFIYYPQTLFFYFSIYFLLVC